MKCEICHKRDATTAYTHIVDDVKKTLLLCADCIPTEKKHDEEKLVGAASAKGQTKQDVPTLIKKAKVEFATSAAESGAVAEKCASCGMTYDQFKKAGRLGCQCCYETFAVQLDRLLKRIHGANKHCGKGRIAPGEIPAPTDELDQLGQELKDAVQREDFERAAQLRDQIRSMDAGAGGRAG